ncbi:MAG: SDR family oxidoreductase [Aestuariivita sp.]|nr:SDR family oxidoreductase [Aestuariivita sp.]MCY4203055.1 SDR family oxidoreductase [Aestuariivita sp.]MCY4289349.1 SDR family oxidoreductase [Aestuariivita sp.]MCY4347768.1 SDR family oxidoreductase [Aestuariivita sp.]
MDLKIKGKRALVCASSKGLGFGCAEALARAGVNLIINGRNEVSLIESAAKFRDEYHVTVEVVAADLTTREGRDAIKASAAGVDILVTNGGGPPPGVWTEWSREDLLSAIDSNMLMPIELIQAIVPQMMERGWGRVVNITSQAVKSPIPELGLSNTARTGLTGFVAGVARQVAPFGVSINNLLPGIHATDRAISLDRAVANRENITVSDARQRREATIPARRYGTVEEFGATCAFLCSTHAGYIIGQNILLDGGSVKTTF